MPRKTNKRAPDVVDARHPSREKGDLKYLGGSASDAFNNVLANQVINALWLAHVEGDERQKLLGRRGRPRRDRPSAAMECYRRAMISEQSSEGRKECLTQANKLSRTYTTLLEALNRHRGKGQQKVTVEHVHVHSGGQAIVGAVEHPGEGRRPKNGSNPMQATI